MHRLIPQFILENFAAGNHHGKFRAVSLFADISGFSAMTDTLMNHGQHGAEVLADVMRAAFAPLIQAVFEHDGFIVSQAGDSFSALFPMASNQDMMLSHSLAATKAIYQRAAEKPIHSTPYGEFQVSIKLGLAFGEVAWGIVSSTDEFYSAYYFSGSIMEAAAEAEHHAAPGDVILDISIFEQVNQQVKVNQIDTYYKLAEIIGKSPEPKKLTLTQPDIEIASRFLPRDLFIQEHAGEFRNITSLFVSLPTIRTEGQLQIFMQTVFKLQSLYGGLLELRFGDKGAHLLLIWGAPRTYENDIQRAITFIRELQTQTAIPINGGITHRIAHAGFIGSALTEQYSAYGRGVNLAARFMTNAPRGEIWLDEQVAKRVQNQFELEFLGEKKFKGFSKPQKVYSLFERIEELNVAYDGRLVGRESELGILRAFVEPIFNGNHAGVLIILGEPGIGKTRLVNEFLSGLENERSQYFLCTAQCDQILRSSMNPFRFWLRHYFDQSEGQSEARNKRSFNRKLDDLINSINDQYLTDELDRTRSFLGALLGLEWPDSLYEQVDAENRYENTFIGLISLLQAESMLAPVILLLEDIHWIDKDSKAFLPRLIRSLTADELKHYPIAILSTAREVEPEPPLDGFLYREIRLRELDRTAVMRQAESLLGGQVSETLADLLAERSDGNPFFCEQIIKYLQAADLLSRDEHGWTIASDDRLPLPSDVHSLLVARLDQLEKDVREVVLTAAIIGREFDVGLISQMLNQDLVLIQKINKAESASIWHPIGKTTYMFRHALLRDAAYQMQIHARRCELHALAMQALETTFSDHIEPKFGELAYHAEQAGFPDKARQYLLLAGNQAKNAYQNTLALDYYSRALELTPEELITEQFELKFERQQVFGILGMQDERFQDLKDLDRLSEKSGEEENIASIKLSWADYFHDLGEFTRAQAAAEQAIDLVTNLGDMTTAIKAYHLLSASLLRQGLYDAAKTKANAGIAIAQQTQDRLNEGILLNSLGMIAYESRELASARDYFERALTAIQETGNLRMHAHPLNSLALITGYQGEWNSSQMYYQQALEIFRQVGDRIQEGIVLGNLGWIAGAIGDFETARGYAEQNLRIAREVGHRFSETYGLINLSSYANALGDIETALSCSQQALRLAQNIGDRSGEAWALTYLGHSQIDSRNPIEATDSYRTALKIRQDLDQQLLATEPATGLAYAALIQVDLPSAIKFIEPVLEYLEAGGTLDGTDQPMRVYLICYLVLHETNPSNAQAILKTAYDNLMVDAGKITDDSKRQIFLNNIWYNREIVAAYIEQSE